MTRQTDTTYDHHRGGMPLLQETDRWRVAVFAALDLVLFVAANALWQYLASGQGLDFSLSSYRRDLGVPLGEILLRPLSVFEYPWMLGVVGVLLGAIIMVPVMIAVLYRLRLAALFVIVVAAVGHAPVLAAALGVGCLLAARTRLRSDMPFLAALLGLAPVAAYLYFFGFFGSESATVQPLQRLVLAGPFVLAVVVAVLAAAAVLGLAAVTRFRPDIVWPVLVVLLAAPAATYYTQIGPAELNYALLAEGLASEEAIFPPVAMDTWSRQNRTEGLNPQTLRIRIRDDLQRRRQKLMARCLRFVNCYPGSERAPAVLWLAAQATSLQLDGSALQVGLLKYTASYPVQVSAALWQRLVGDYGSSPQAGLAYWRLGQLAMRRREVHQAYQYLTKAQALLATQTAKAPASPPTGSSLVTVFTPPPRLPSNRYYADAAFAAARLVWLMDLNDVLNDPPSAEALAAYLNCNPHDAYYVDRLSELAGVYEHTNFGDNLKLAVAMACPDLYERAEMLILLAGRENSDAAVEANYELGCLAMRTAEAPALPLVEDLRPAEEYFQAVHAAGPSPWRALAAEHLAALARLANAASTAPAGSP